MRSDSLFAAFGAAPSLALSLLSVLYVVVSAYVYISLIHYFSFAQYWRVSFASLDRFQRGQSSGEFPSYGFPGAFYRDFPPASWF